MIHKVIKYVFLGATCSETHALVNEAHEWISLTRGDDWQLRLAAETLHNEISDQLNNQLAVDAGDASAKHIVPLNFCGIVVDKDGMHMTVEVEQCWTSRRLAQVGEMKFYVEGKVELEPNLQRIVHLVEFTKFCYRNSNGIHGTILDLL
jgi:hypothetical protein